MNVLLTCAGRRNYLVEYFKEAVGPEGRLLAADASAQAPALVAADQAFVVPLVSAPNYTDVLIDICRRHHVGLIVSLNDLELPLLARERSRFLEIGAFPVVPTEEIVDLCFDKLATSHFLESAGLSGPVTLSTLEDAEVALADGSLSFPMVLKPRWGTASIGIEVAEDEGELTSSYHNLRRKLARTIIGDVSGRNPERSILIQQRLGGDEYGLDVVNDFSGKHVATFVKKKLAMRAGETDRATVCSNATLERVGRIIGERLGHVGNLDCDVFLVGADAFVLELNPRFGGGYPFSHAAGANVPAAMIAWAEGVPPSPEWFEVESGVVAAKYDSVVRVSGNG